MLTIEKLREFGADTREGLTRCMNNEAFYLRLVGMCAKDGNFTKLYDALAAGDLDAGFEAAHALKGSMGNLALTPIYDQVCRITELLRAKQDADYAELLSEIKEAESRLKEICNA